MFGRIKVIVGISCTAGILFVVLFAFCSFSKMCTPQPQCVLPWPCRPLSASPISTTPEKMRRFVILPLSKQFCGNGLKENAHIISVACLKVRGHLVDLGIDGKTTLKFTLMKDGVRYVRDSYGPRGGLL